NPETIHLGDRLLAEGREPVPFPAVSLAGVRIGQLIVAVVGERQVASSTIMEFLPSGDFLADGIAVLDAHQSDFFPLRFDSAYVGGVERQLNLVRRNLMGETVNGVEFFDGCFVGALVARGLKCIWILRFSRLADINTKK